MPANETLFRIVTGILFALCAGTRIYFQSTITGSPIVHARHERRERFFYVAIGLTLIPVVLYVLTPLLTPFHLNTPTWLRWSGAAGLLAGILLFSWTHRSLGSNWSGMLELREGQSLVSDGPYRLVRHPMYSAMLLMGAGLGLLSANLLVWSYFLVFLVMYLVRVGDEESMMLEQFGAPYARYCERTGRLIPPVRDLWRSN